MKFLLVLLALLGYTCALQPSSEYEFMYESRVAVGIPATSAQVAALGIKARLFIQMKTKSQGIARFMDVQVGEFNEDTKCALLRPPIPFKWSPMPQHLNNLTKPFEIFPTEEMGHVMTTFKNEAEYITNIKKAAIGALRVYPVLANSEGMMSEKMKMDPEGRAPVAFSVEEETIFGRCESQYSLTKLPQHMFEKDKEMILNHQSSSGQMMSKSGDSYYHLVKAVNFDKCNDRVVLQHTSISNTSEIGHAHLRSAGSRSSIGSFILKGRPGEFDVHRAVVEGDLINNPFGFRTSRLRAMTNQTMVLIAVKPLLQPMALPRETRDVKTWRFEVASPFAPPSGHPKPWVNYYSGNDPYHPFDLKSIVRMPPSPEMIMEHKRNCMELLKKIVEYAYGEPSLPSPSNLPSQSTPEAKALTYLHYATRIMRLLPRSEVDQIFMEIFGATNSQDPMIERKKMMLCDIAAASGAAAPIHALLEKIKSGQVPHSRIPYLFMTMPNNIYAPSIIPELVKYAKTVDFERSPVLASTVLVNVASVIEKVCLDTRKFNYSVPNPILGKEACSHAEVTHDFLSYLEQKAKQASKPYERAVYVQAIANLGSPVVLPILRSFIHATRETDKEVRTIAMYGLTRARMPDSTKEAIFDTLMEIVENYREDPVVRQVAFSCLLTWKPSAAFWQRMARMTWKEPSHRMAAFVSSTIQSIARSTEPNLRKQAKYTSFALPLLRPFSPSMRFSHNYFYSRFDQQSQYLHYSEFTEAPDSEGVDEYKGVLGLAPSPVLATLMRAMGGMDEVGFEAEFAYIQSRRELMPERFFASILANAGDLRFQLVEAGISSFGLTEDVFDIMDSLRSTAEESTYPSAPKGVRSSFYQDMLKKMMKHVYAPESSSVESKNASIYLRAFENMYQYIPLNKHIIEKMVEQRGMSFMNMLVDGYKMNMTKYLDPITLDYMVQNEIGFPLLGVVSTPTLQVAEIEMKLSVPGVPRPTLHDIYMAKRAVLIFKTNYKFITKTMARVEVLAPWDNKVVKSGVETLKQINLPIYGNFTFNFTSEVKNLTLNVAPFMQKPFPVVHVQNVPYTELGDLMYSTHSRSDYKVIAARKSRMPIIKYQSEMPKRFTGMRMTAMYQGDAADPFFSGFISDYLRKPEYLAKIIGSPSVKQYHYALNVYPEASTRNVSLSLAYLTPKSLRNSSTSMTAFSPRDSTTQRLEKLRHFSEGAAVYALQAHLMFNGSEFRKYEALVAVAMPRIKDKTKEYKVATSLMADVIPGYSQSPMALCTKAHVSTPHIADVDMLKRLMQSQPKEKIRGEFYFGENCASSKIGDYLGTAEISHERANRIFDELIQICNYDPVDPSVELQTPAVYDQARLEINFSKNKIPKSLLNVTYIIQRNLEGATYPHGYYDDMYRGRSNHIAIEAERPLANDGYTFLVSLPQKRSIFTEIKVPYLASRVVPLTGLKTSMNQYSSLMVSKATMPICRISSDQVIAFDQVRYHYTPLHCWTSAALERSKPSDVVVYTRKAASGELEAQIMHYPTETIVVISKRKAIINGTPMPSNEPVLIVNTTTGHIVMKIMKQSDYYEVEVTGKFIVIARNEIEVMPFGRMIGNLIGLCGEFDGEKIYDNRGPKGCLYTDRELFKYAWTIPEGSDCDVNMVKNMHNKVHEFQRHCIHAPSGSYQEIKSMYESKSTDCLIHVYPVKKQGMFACVSKESLQTCSDMCSLVSKRNEQKPAKCWPMNSAPKEVMDAMRMGYVKYPVRAEAKIQRTVRFPYAVNCVRY